MLYLPGPRPSSRLRVFTLAAVIAVACVTVAAGSGCGGSPYAEADASDATVDADSGAGDGAVDAAVPTAKVVTCNNTFASQPAEGTCAATRGAAEGVLIVAGAVLAPDTVYENGQLLLVEQQIVCVGCDCGGHAQAAGAARLDCPQGVVSPGLVNPHDHLTFTEGHPPTWTARYDHRHEWRKGLNGKPKISTPSNTTPKDNIGPLWGELRHLLAGTTSIMGAGGGDGLLRNLDSAKTEGLSGRAVAPTFPLGDSDGKTRVETCDYATLPSEVAVQAALAWVPHVAEGINHAAHNELLCLSGQRPGATQTSHDNVTYIHGIALTARDALDLAQRGTAINWSPRSNVSLYGMTADIPMLKNAGVEISIGTDWTYSGSINLLRELACASYLNQTHFDRVLSQQDLWRMVTSNAADAAGFGDRLGRLKEGYVSDIAIFDGRKHQRFEAITNGSVAEVALVMRGGKALYGDVAVVEALSAAADCEPFDLCGARRLLCLKSEIGLTLAEMRARFPAEVNGKPYEPYDLFFCGPPTNEPTCVPSRPGEYDGQPTAEDSDGDGVPDAIDSCPRIFNPPRPMHGGKQPDTDGDNVGDECDPCPLDPHTTQCSKVDPNDRDGDGIDNERDNCPNTFNPDQKDSDGDGIGDACDPCPLHKGTCPFLIQELRDSSLGKRPSVGTPVRIEQAVVTAIRTVKSLGFYIRQGKGSHQALFVFTSTAPKTSDSGAALQEGDVVNIEGDFDVYRATDQVSGVTLVEVVGQGADASALVVQTKDLQPGSARAEELESHLVRVSGAKVVAMVAVGDDDFWLSDDGQTCTGTAPPCTRVGDFFYDGGANDGKPAVVVGQVFSAVTGVVNGFDDIHTLDVRSDGDLQ